MSPSRPLAIKAPCSIAGRFYTPTAHGPTPTRELNDRTPERQLWAQRLGFLALPYWDEIRDSAEARAQVRRSHENSELPPLLPEQHFDAEENEREDEETLLRQQ
jgi:hypothetical protein